jgi:hypothetical protein
MLTKFRHRHVHQVMTSGIFIDGDRVRIAAVVSNRRGAGDDSPRSGASRNNGSICHIRVVADLPVRVLQFEISPVAFYTGDLFAVYLGRVDYKPPVLVRVFLRCCCIVLS